MSHAFTRHSPSACNLFKADLAMFVMEKVLGNRLPVGPAAYRGTAVEAGVSAGLFKPDMSEDECVAIAQKEYATLTAFAEPDEKKAAPIRGMVVNALRELRPLGVPSSSQGRVDLKLDTLTYPIIGYYDFRWDPINLTVDLKAPEKLPTKRKDGTYIPKGEHCQQIAYYDPGNGELRLTYTTASTCVSIPIEDAQTHRAEFFATCQTIERFLKLSDDPMTLAQAVRPSPSSFYWNTPAARDAARRVWGVRL